MESVFINGPKKWLTIQFIIKIWWDIFLTLNIHKKLKKTFDIWQVWYKAHVYSHLGRKIILGYKIVNSENTNIIVLYVRK